MTETLCIAIANLQLGIGTTRGYWQYLATGWKYLLPHGSGPIDRAADFLRMERIDIATFCEIEGGSWRSMGVDQVERIARGSNLQENVFFPTFMVGSRIYQGNAICTHFPLHFIKNHALPGPGEPRFLSEAEVMIGDVAVRIFVTHLSLYWETRIPQIHHIAEIISSREKPIVLAGDFNVSEEAELDLLTETVLQKAVTAPSFPSWQPKMHLDHLFFTDHFTIVDTYVFDHFRFSDHLPLVAAITLNTPAAATATTAGERSSRGPG